MFIPLFIGVHRPAKCVIDITLGYNPTPSSLTEMIKGTQATSQIEAHVRKFPITEIPLNEDELQTWLIKRFTEKEGMLEEFHRHGRFTQESNNNNTINKANTRQITKSYITYVMCCSFSISSSGIFIAILTNICRIIINVIGG